MRTLLVFPRFKYASGQPPLGVASLYGYIRRHRPQDRVDVFDATFATNGHDDFERLVVRETYDVVGFSLMCTMLDDLARMVKVVRMYQPEALVVCGGPHATVASELLLRRRVADVVVLGEGEQSLAELLENAGDPEGIGGLAYMRKGRITCGPVRQPVGNLDSLGTPDRSAFDMASYVRLWNSMDCVDTQLRGTSIIASRGCPYQCSYCQPTMERIFGRRVRMRSPQAIVAELHALKRDYGIEAFMFEDDTLMMSREWVIGICDALETAELGLVWCCNTRADLCSGDLLRRMRAAGLRKINIGIESASQSLLDEVFQKRITLDDVHRAVLTAKKEGLCVQGYFMLGHPSETDVDILATILLARQLDIDDATFSVTTPLLGTHLFQREREIVATEDGNADYYGRSVYRPEAMRVPGWRVRLYKSLAYVVFYTRLRRLWQQIRVLGTPVGRARLRYKLARVR